MVASDVIQLPLLFAGVPSPEEASAMIEHRAKGGKTIYFVTPEERASTVLATGEAGVVWHSDEFVKKFLFENIHGWMGGKLGNIDQLIGGTVGDMARAQHLASMMHDVLALYSFDHTSASHLFKDGEPQRNMFRNHRWMEDGTAFQLFKGRGKGVITILVAAGPSLDSQWEHLRRIRETMPNVGFIVCGRSYKQAMKNGLKPEFVQEVEQYEWNDRLFLFAPEPPSSTYLVGPLTACPNVYHSWPNKGQVVITWDHNYAQLMGKTKEEIERHEFSMDGGNSVIHHMFNFAAWLGSEVIGLAGVDLAYPPGHKATHADGTFHMWRPDIMRTERAYQAPLQVKSTDGGEVLASQPYKNFATFLEISISKTKEKFIPGLRVINFSPHGQKIEGTEYEDISTWGLPSPAPSSALPSSPLQSGPVAFSASLVSASTLTSTEPSQASCAVNAPLLGRMEIVEGEPTVSDLEPILNLRFLKPKRKSKTPSTGRKGSPRSTRKTPGSKPKSTR
jgi:hypothetical protein